MNDTTYELLHIDESYGIPRALILVLHNDKPSCLYQIDCYGYELPPFDERSVQKEVIKS